MAGEVGNIGVRVAESYHNFVVGLDPGVQAFINIGLLSILVALFFIFIWKLYHIIAKKNLLDLNLRQYNTTSHPGFKKFISTLLYLAEYIVIFPFFVIFWFSMFMIFVMLLARNLELSTVLTISTIIIIVIRVTAYYKESLSKDIAKLLPFTLLAVAITEKDFFKFENIFTRASEIPLFFENILMYVAIIVILEVILRVIDLIISLFRGDDSDEEETEEAPSPKDKK